MANMIVFTDGSYKKPKTGILCGYGIHFPNKEFPDVSKKFTKTPLTNQRAELYAIYKAIKIVSKGVIFSKLTIYTDSEYSIKSLTIWINKWIQNGWKTANNKPVLNVDIIKKIHKLMSKHENKIELIHVRSHTGKKDFISIGNDVADTLASIGASK